MSRHPFSRRARRRMRKGVRTGLRFSACSRPFAQIREGWARFTPRFAKLTGRRIFRWSHRRGPWRPKDRPVYTIKINRSDDD